jgi:hypothetical protein
LPNWAFIVDTNKVRSVHRNSDNDKHPSKRETKMTESQKSRIVQAIKECDSFIAKEEPRNSGVRPDEITKLLAFYYSHREMLQKKLACN